MKSLKYIFTFVMISLSTAVFAQDNIISFNYQIGTPLGHTRSFIDNSAYNGFGIEYRHFLNDKVSIGLDMSWTNFYEDVPGYSYYNIKGDNGQDITIGGKEFRYGEMRPLMLTSHYYLGESGGIRPFVGLGLGINYVELSQDVGSVTFYDNKWLFAMRPEIGVFVPLSPNVGILTAAKYNYSVGAGSMDAQSFMSFNFGFAFTL
ncbi:porin family protein [Sediminitomix flava]|uniref:Outer membrane protein n=1 Tax=Sediminitomix flava TaxID=379075 RepID=A0A315ZDU0_SEDFL|nr:OmpW family outer membrane protein [Sediminitomix flava]PWJ43786.1 outer membrane protein [Sediminitomix flava]